MFGRDIRTVLHLLKPDLPGKQKRNNKMEEQFNKKHGAGKKSFAPGDLVFVRVYFRNRENWVPGKIIEKIGCVLYNVFLEKEHKIIRSHTNQLKPRKISNVSPLVSNHTIPLEVLLDNFELSTNTNNGEHEPTQELPYGSVFEIPIY